MNEAKEKAFDKAVDEFYCMVFCNQKPIQHDKICIYNDDST